MLTSSKTYIVLFLLSLAAIISAKPVERKNFLFSAFFPGTGEIVSGHNSGYAFLATDVLIWSSKYYFIKESQIKDTQSYIQALKYAHVNTDVTFDELYIAKIKKYISSGFEPGGYNENVLHDAIKEYPDDTDKQDEYIEANMIPDDKAWRWDSNEDRHDFSIMRKRILEYTNYLQITTGVLIANRLLSMIDLIRIKKTIDIKVTVNSNFTPVLCIKYSF